jgi:predicted NBD/HSP70 family sugar kinase
LLRRLNSSAILRALYDAATPPDGDPQAADPDSGAMTLTEIARTCGVSRPTAEDVVESLLRQGWVDEEQPDAARPRGAGRPARRFRFRASAGYVLGIDIGSRTVLAQLADLAGTVVASRRSAVSVSDDPDTFARERIASVRRAVSDSLEAAGVDRARLLATVVGTTGIIDVSGRVLLRNVWPGWAGLHLAAALEEFLPTRVIVHNDIRLGAVAERWRGAARGSNEVVYLHVGARLGSGFLLDGGVHRGFNGAAGELPKDSAVRWVRAYNKLLAQSGAHPAADAAHPSSTTIAGDATPVFAAAAAGDETAQRATEVFAREFIKGVEGLVVTMDPEVVVVGGSLSQAGELVAEPVRRHLAKACLFPPRVAISPLGDDSVALGAIRVALDTVETQVFTDVDPAPAAAGSTREPEGR